MIKYIEKNLEIGLDFGLIELFVDWKIIKMVWISFNGVKVEVRKGGFYVML